MATITVPTMTPRSGPTGGPLDDANDFFHIADSATDNRLPAGSAKNYILEGVKGGSNITETVNTSTYDTTVALDTTLTGLVSVTSTDFVGDLTGDVTGDVTGDLTGDVTGDVTGDLTGDVTGDVTGDLTGNADTATALETARTIAGNSFDGTANIDIALSDLSDVSSTTPSTGETLSWSGTDWAPSTAGAGSVISVAIAGTDGIDVDSGSPITSSGTITLGLSSVPNSSLANSSVTVAGQTVALGASATVGITDLSDVYSSMSPSDGQALVYDTTNGWQAETLAGDIEGVTAGTNLNGGGTSGTVTINLDTTLTGLTSVTSTGFTGALTGNASTATALETARNIAGVSFDGTGDISVPITGLSDVYASMSPSDGDVLTYDTTNGWQSETPTTGDITGVTAGTGLTGGGTSGAVTLDLSTPVSVAHGGTGQTTYTNGQLLIGNTTGNTLAKSTLTAGTNVTITNGTGTIEIAATDTDTTYTAGDGLDLTGTEFSTDLKTNGGLVIESTELALDLGASSITGNLGVSNLNSGTSASSTTFWRGDGTWASVPSTGDPAGTAVAMAIALGG
jgi:hypothetical protein|tara:strand:+ start:1930 stop:3630 length:1701 start_codon:yes stop_codon:yes gene_type:complete